MNAVFSIKPRFSDKIFRLEKTVELRRGRVHLRESSIVWIYTTRPRAKFEGSARVACVIVGSPSEIWRQFNGAIGLTRSEFRRYTQGSILVSAIGLTDVRSLPEPLPLAAAKMVCRQFHPPQSYMNLCDGNALLLKLEGLRISDTLTLPGA